MQSKTGDNPPMARKPTETAETVGTVEIDAGHVTGAAHAGAMTTTESHDAPIMLAPDARLGTDEVLVNGMRVTVKKRVAMPVLPFRDDMTIIVRFIDAIHKGKEITEGAGGKPKMAVAMVATVSSMTGEQRTLICGEVLQREMADAYPNDAYVGAWFMLTRLAAREGKKYATFVINEIEPPSGDYTPAQTAIAG
jgi:hypothetical protein